MQQFPHWDQHLPHLSAVQTLLDKKCEQYPSEVQPYIPLLLVSNAEAFLSNLNPEEITISDEGMDKKKFFQRTNSMVKLASWLLDVIESLCALFFIQFSVWLNIKSIPMHCAEPIMNIVKFKVFLSSNMCLCISQGP